jgi:starch phosphorylase
VGQSMQVEAMIDLPKIKADEVTVQLYCGPASAAGNIEEPQALVMEHSKEMAPDRHIFIGKFDCRSSGRQGYAVRILPGNPDLATPFEPGLILWN